jgi:hypothetical protein
LGVYVPGLRSADYEAAHGLSENARIYFGFYSMNSKSWKTFLSLTNLQFLSNPQLTKVGKYREGRNHLHDESRLFPPLERVGIPLKTTQSLTNTQLVGKGRKISNRQLAKVGKHCETTESPEA